MPGEPLHHCAKDHQTMLYTGTVCPYCTLRLALATSAAQVAQLTEQLRQRTRALERALTPSVKET
jgi:hypothetical protein